MNLGLELVSCIIEDQSLRPFIVAGIDRKWLSSSEGFSDDILDDQYHGAFSWILDHWDKHKRVPTKDLFRRNFPADSLKLTDEPIAASEVVEEIVTEVHRLMVFDLVMELKDLHDDLEIPAAVAKIREVSAKLAQGVNEALQLPVYFGDPEFDIDKFLDTKIEMGVPMGIEPVDKVFMGWQDGQLITLLGRQKSLKTFLMLLSAYHAWREGYTVIFYNVEMDESILRQRLYGIGANVEPEDIRRGLITDGDRKRIKALHGEMQRDYKDVDFVVLNRPNLTVADIEQDVTRLNPASKPAVYVDGVYFMTDEQTGKPVSADWQAMDNVAADLKNLAMYLRVPFMVSTQVREKQHNASRKGIEAKSIMTSDGFLKSSDLVMGADKDYENGIYILNDVRNRFISFEPVYFRWNWDTMEYTILEEDEVDTEGI